MNTSARFVVVADTETGGLPNKDKRAFYDVALVEVACVVVDCVQLKIVDEYSQIIAPYKDGLEYSPGAEATHGLSYDHLCQYGADAKDVYGDVKKILTTYKNPRIGAIFVGHNFLTFDIPFFEGLFEFFKDNLWSHVKFVEDTMMWGWLRATEQENYKLGTCCKQEKVQLVDAHRALNDTKANAQLFIKYLEYLRGSGTSGVVAPTGMVPSRFREAFQL